MTGKSPGPDPSPELLGAATEAFVQTALIAGGVGLWEWQLDTGRLRLSPHLEALLGYPAGSFDGRVETFRARVMPVDRARIDDEIAAAAERGEAEVEFRVLDVAGLARWFVARGRALRDAAGAAVRVLGTMQEIPAGVVTERRMRRQQASLLELLAGKRVTGLPLEEALRHITEAAGRTLEVERASVWLFTPGGEQLRCANLYRRSLRQHMTGAELTASAYPTYFAALAAGRTLAAEDAHRDPRTRELARDYLAPLGITSMLEAPIRHDGRLAGVVCHEHVGPIRHWLLDEQGFAASVADLVSMVLDAEARRALDRSLARSEERYRAFVSLSTEAILRVEIDPPVALDAPVAAQVEHVRRHGVVAEANGALARLLGRPLPEPIVGCTIESLLPAAVAEKLLGEWIASGYRFSEYETDVVGADGTRTWLLGSMIGVVDEGRLVALWSTWRDVTRRRSALAALEHQARHDPLTGLPNRKWLAERLATLLGHARAERTGLALMMMDLDHFKEINDALGHFAGDQLLKLIGPRLAPILAARDGELARLGGDEFAIIARNCPDRASAQRLATELIDALREPFPVGQLRLGIDASVGAAICPTHGSDASTLMRCADVAMYEAKRKGLRAAVYDVSLDRYSPRRLALANALGEAVRNGEVRVEYQPILSLRERRVAGVEALARWHHPEFGLVRPGEFVPLAEMGDQIRHLTLRVLTDAARDWQRWLARALPVRVAVNLSTRVLLDQGFVAETRRILKAFDMPGERLCFEITESAMLADTTRALENLERLNALGVGIVIDDFGVGFSSLAYLKQVPLEALKIDRTFIGGMAASARDASIVRSTINLAHDLGLRVVAEGVETAQALQRVEEMGCDEAQGYLIAAPRPAAEVTAWLERGGWR